MKAKAYRILHESRGQALVETALILPLLVLLVIGVFEFSRSIQANNIVVAMSREAANLASRTTASPQDIMDAVGDTAQPLVMTAHGMIIITKVQGVTKNGKVQTVVVKSVRPVQMGKRRLQRGQQNRDPQWNKLPVNIPNLYTGKWRCGLGDRGFL